MCTKFNVIRQYRAENNSWKLFAWVHNVPQKCKSHLNTQIKVLLFKKMTICSLSWTIHIMLIIISSRAQWTLSLTAKIFKNCYSIAVCFQVVFLPRAVLLHTRATAVKWLHGTTAKACNSCTTDVAGKTHPPPTLSWRVVRPRQT